MTPDAVKIQDTGKGKRAVADDLEAAGDHPDDFLADVVLHNRGAVLDSIMEDRLLAETGKGTAGRELVEASKAKKMVLAQALLKTTTASRNEVFLLDPALTLASIPAKARGLPSLRL
jgi:hypothetical protein